MKKQFIGVAFAFVLVLFLASPLFEYAVGANTLSAEEIAALREEYPQKDTVNPLTGYLYPFTFSREAQRADTIIYGEVMKSSKIRFGILHTVYVFDSSRGGVNNGTRIEVFERQGYEAFYLQTGDRFATPLWKKEGEETRWDLYPNSMFYVTDDGYVLSVFDESDRFLNYDQKIHSGMTVQALLRKYRAWDGMLSPEDFETFEEGCAWLDSMGYLTYG